MQCYDGRRHYVPEQMHSMSCQTLNAIPPWTATATARLSSKQKELTYSLLPPAHKMFLFFLTESWNNHLEPNTFLKWLALGECSGTSSCERNTMVSKRFKALSCTSAALHPCRNFQLVSHSGALPAAWCLLPAMALEWLPSALGNKWH